MEMKEANKAFQVEKEAQSSSDSSPQAGDPKQLLLSIAHSITYKVREKNFFPPPDFLMRSRPDLPRGRGKFDWWSV